MITLEILEEAVGIEHLSDNEYSELDTHTQELFFSFSNEMQQPHSNTIVNL
ncbi:hypothetical protein [Legionella longbeachae]|uniref:hypothetical protein n=1 Tax=Legionella longbeachae TaxID=450 RepID=UPI000F6D3FC5|nr:hypothetical protein [Legionella longbeachae]UAK45787.1 hypothetical protein K8O86_13470 [Legionella longbeachae]VEE02725.1 Uncharacterised protein [Legionella oakridgensis]